jgi:hypothetical protein
MGKDIWAVIEVDCLLSMDEMESRPDTTYSGEWGSSNVV